MCLRDCWLGLDFDAFVLGGLGSWCLLGLVGFSFLLLLFCLLLADLFCDLEFGG